MALLGTGTVEPTAAERRAVLPGDVLVQADVQMDRAFDLPAPPEQVWPWLVQLGKRRAGWYLPRSVERFVPAPRRAVRHVVPTLQHLEVGEVVPDWGGRDATLTLAWLDPPRALVHTSHRGTLDFSWALVLTPTAAEGSRLHSRVRWGPYGGAGSRSTAAAPSTCSRSSAWPTACANGSTTRADAEGAFRPGTPSTARSARASPSTSADAPRRRSALPGRFAVPLSP